MKRNQWVLGTAGMAAVLFSVTACAPMQEFAKEHTKSFSDCMVKGMATSVVGGVLVGGATGNKSAGVVVGLAGMITTWVTCGDAWKEVKSSAQGDRSQALANTRGRSPTGPLDLVISDFSVAATKPGENLLPNAHYSVLSNDPARKDIKLKETWKFWIPQVSEDPRNKQVKVSYPNFQTAKFSNDVTTQQGKRGTGGKLPTPGDLPDNPAWYAMFMVEGDGVCVASITSMEFGKTGRGRPVSCDSTPGQIVPLASNEAQALPSAASSGNEKDGNKAVSPAGKSKSSGKSSKKKTSTAQ